MIRGGITSNTELDKMTSCEMSWWLRYAEEIKGEPSDAMLLGRLMHELVGVWESREDWEAYLRHLIVEEGGDAHLIDLDALEGVPATAVWLMRRYVANYFDDQADWSVVEHELNLTATLPGGMKYQAIIDAVWQTEPYGHLWIVERKTYGRRDRIKRLDMDPQITGNLWVARANGIPAKGIVFDGIYTYRWKPEKPTLAQLEAEIMAGGWGGGTKADLRVLAKELQQHQDRWNERPIADSFTRLWLDRNDAHIAGAIDELQNQVTRRNLLADRKLLPVRNIGSTCDYCDQRSACFERLAFTSGFDLIEDDDEAA